MMIHMDRVHLGGTELIPDIVYKQQDEIQELYHKICLLNEEIAKLNEIIYDLKEELATHKGYHTDDNGYVTSLKTYNGVICPSHVDITTAKEIDAMYENIANKGFKTEFPHESKDYLKQYLQ